MNGAKKRGVTRVRGLPAQATLADRMTTLLGEQIRSGAYPVNARLPTEQRMTQSYGVSRTVVREAMARLRSQGLVDTRQGRGTVVLDPRAADAFRLGTSDTNPALGVIRIIELRRGIEVEMAALAAERRSAADVLGLVRALNAIDEAVQRGGDGVNEDLAFHMAISRATGNPHYVDLLGMLTRAVRDAIRMTRSNEARMVHFSEQVRREHAAIKQAIETGDAAAARAAAREHMLNAVRRLEGAGDAYWSGERVAMAERLASADLGSVLRNGDGEPSASGSVQPQQPHRQGKQA